MVGEVTMLYASDPFYKTRTINSLADVTIPAIALNRYKVWVRDKKLRGFCVWAFATQEEIEADDWKGVELLSRKEGDEIRFLQFICNGGRKDTIMFVRHIRDSLSKQYPKTKYATSNRLRIDGSMRPKKWFRKETQ